MQLDDSIWQWHNNVLAKTQYPYSLHVNYKAIIYDSANFYLFSEISYTIISFLYYCFI